MKIITSIHHLKTYFDFLINLHNEQSVAYKTVFVSVLSSCITNLITYYLLCVDIFWIFTFNLKFVEMGSADGESIIYSIVLIKMV